MQELENLARITSLFSKNSTESRTDCVLANCGANVSFSFTLTSIIRNAFIFKNGNRRYKYLVLGHEETYFVKKEHSDSKSKYSEDDIIKILEFLVDNIFVVFAGKVFQQTVGIPMGTNCAPLLADIFMYSYEADFIQSLLSTGKSI